MTIAPDQPRNDGSAAACARLTVLSGPSAVGKSTVAEQLRANYPQVWVSVSATTREPRQREVDGVHYFFVDERRFAQLVEDGALLEWARYAGHLYGTPRAPVEEKLAAGIPVLLEIDVQGARQVRERMPRAQLVFLAPPSWEELERRLVGRGTETAQVIERRLASAREELAAQPDFDLTLVNVDVRDVCAQLVAWMEIPLPTCEA